MARLPVPAPAQDPPPRDLTQEMLDLGREIRAAQNKLIEVEALQRFAKDESAPMWGAISAFCGVMWRVTDRWATMIEDMRAVVSQQRTLNVKDLSKAAAAGLSNTLMSEVIQALKVHAARTLRQTAVRMTLCAVVAAAAVSGAMWWWLQPPATTCFDQQGGRFCGQWVIPERTK
jgi:hypothetical protein